MGRTRAQFMADLVGIEGSMEEVEEVDEWIGLNIIGQFKSDKEKMMETLLGEIASKGDPMDEGYEFDDIAAGGGAHSE